jgi:hypothetical protein
MEDTATPAPGTNLVRAFFGVVARGRTWANLVYLALAFPLGLAWFVFLVTGLSLGVGLAITIVGIPLLLVMMLAWRLLATFERWLAVTLLGAEIGPSPVLTRSATPGAWARLKAILSDSLTWRGLVFLVVRFPLGLVTFVAVVTLGALVGALVTAPFTYRLATIDLGVREVTTLGGALACAAVGLLLLVVTLHAWNGLATVHGWVARVLLRPASPRPTLRAGADLTSSEATASGASARDMGGATGASRSDGTPAGVTGLPA